LSGIVVLTQIIMILSRACEYGVQALIYLHSRADGEYVSVPVIARAQKISPSFLSKIVRQLVTNKLLDSMKGPGGGVRLSRPADRIQLLDIVRAIDGLEGFERCVIGEPHCSDRRPCPVHSFWLPIRQSIHKMFSEHSLSDLSQVRMKAERRSRKPSRKSSASTRRRKGA
jgi:Rrf2 family protein